MFILLFVVIFGPKKGVQSNYSSFWNYKAYTTNSVLINHFKRRTSRYLMDYYFKYRYQFTAVTSRTTIYVLFVFWCFFFFFGETLFLITFNFSTLTDSIPSNFFLSLKSHVPFSILNHSALLSNTVMFYIFFFTFSGFFFLINLRYNLSHFYFKNLWLYDFIFSLFLVFLIF